MDRETKTILIIGCLWMLGLATYFGDGYLYLLTCFMMGITVFLVIRE